MTTMTYNWTLGRSAGRFLLFAAFITSGALAASRPNVIVIMADDIGAEGLACYGSQIYTTPNLDRMAAQGVRFDNAYATPLCTPTRVMIMSGLYPNRTGYTALMGKSAGTRLPASIRTFGHDFSTFLVKVVYAICRTFFIPSCRDICNR